jgi:hypothetical protein
VRDNAEVYGIEPVIFSGMVHGMMQERDRDHVASAINDWLMAVVSDAPQTAR